jgi:ProP effector
MKASHYRNAAVLGLLAKTWPRCFALFGHRRRPLKLGIRDDIVAALGGAITLAELNCVLRCYAANRHYQLAMRSGAPRIDLDGNEAGSVAAEDAAGVQQWLRKREEKAARRKAAQAQATPAAPAPAAPAPVAEVAPAPAAAAEAALKPKRLGLADLRRAALARKAAAAPSKETNMA